MQGKSGESKTFQPIPYTKRFPFPLFVSIVFYMIFHHFRILTHTFDAGFPRWCYLRFVACAVLTSKVVTGLKFCVFEKLVNEINHFLLELEEQCNTISHETERIVQTTFEASS